MIALDVHDGQCSGQGLHQSPPGVPSGLIPVRIRQVPHIQHTLGPRGNQMLQRLCRILCLAQIAKEAKPACESAWLCQHCKAAGVHEMGPLGQVEAPSHEQTRSTTYCMLVVKIWYTSWQQQQANACSVVTRLTADCCSCMSIGRVAA